MSKGVYPNLLKSDATLMGSFTRADLIVVGVTFLVLSWLKIPALYSLGINAVVYMLFFYVRKNLMPGYFINLNSPRQLNWRNVDWSKYE